MATFEKNVATYLNSSESFRNLYGLQVRSQMDLLKEQIGGDVL